MIYFNILIKKIKKFNKKKQQIKQLKKCKFNKKKLQIKQLKKCKFNKKKQLSKKYQYKIAKYNKIKMKMW